MCEPFSPEILPAEAVIGSATPAAVQDRAQELCESRGGRPGLPSLISLRFLWT